VGTATALAPPPAPSKLGHGHRCCSGTSFGAISRLGRGHRFCLLPGTHGEPTATRTRVQIDASTTAPTAAPTTTAPTANPTTMLTLPTVAPSNAPQMHTHTSRSTDSDIISTRGELQP
jgi:hypothetical protein